MRLLYKPIALIAGLISARIGKSVFVSIWAKFDDQPPPKPGSGEASAGKVIGAKALQGAVMAGVAAGVDRAFAGSFFHFFGIWPDERDEPDKRDKRDKPKGS